MFSRTVYLFQIRVAAAMGPAAYMVNMKGPLTLLAPYADNLDVSNNKELKLTRFLAFLALIRVGQHF